MRGYTLLELMTVVALLGILSVLSAAGLQPLVTRFRTQEAVDATAQFLVRARQRALETGRCHHVEVLEAGTAVVPGNEGDGLRMLRRPTADCVSAANPLTQVEVEVLTLPERMRVRPVAADPIVFLPNGRVQGNLMVQLRVGRDERQEVRALPHGPVCVMETSGGVCP
jgi:prepilin-type N-terminal cleavage/methylation domain-containing protein